MLLDPSDSRCPAGGQNPNDLVDREIAAPNRSGDNRSCSLHRERAIDGKTEEIVALRIAVGKILSENLSELIEASAGAARAAHDRRLTAALQQHLHIVANEGKPFFVHQVRLRK